ncbi:MAG: hypothetical protein HXY40_03530 [Chloroflexi bacterium]|nr:hypothetical protein [Chloroflexota bacterium]
MKRGNLRVLTLLVGAALLVIGASLLLLDGRVAYMQDDDSARYVGAGDCGDCHRTLAGRHNGTAHDLALQNVQDNKEPILADFSQGEDLRSITINGATRAFTADDIAYAVGAGRRVQRYLFATGEREYMVLPAEWNTQTNSWQALPLAPNWPDAAYDWDQNCAACHVTGFEPESGRWEDPGVQCEACHGPGSLHAEIADDIGGNPNDNELVEIRGSINIGIDPQVCGQCHARGSDANNRPYPAGFVPGANLSAVFTLFPADDSAHWYPSGHAQMPNMQYNEWLNAGHAQSLTNLVASGAAIDGDCLTCHSADYVRTERLIDAVRDEDREGDAPEPLTAETAQYGVTCTSCHNPHSEGEQPVYLAQDSYTLCVSCHSDSSVAEGVHHPVREMFEGLPLLAEVPPLENAHFFAEDGPRCVTCHLPQVPTAAGPRASHALIPVLPGAALNVEGLTDTCSGCHAEAVEPALLQELIDDIQNDTRQRLEQARAAVSADTPAWVTQALDFVEGDGSLGIHNYAYTDALLDAVFSALGLFGEGQ